MKQTTKFITKRIILHICIILFMLTGSILNGIAFYSNGNRMPVQTHMLVDDDTHFSFIDKSEVNNYWLTDIIGLKEWHMISIGDIMIYSGAVAIIYFGIWTTIKFRRYKNVERNIN